MSLPHWVFSLMCNTHIHFPHCFFFEIRYLACVAIIGSHVCEIVAGGRLTLWSLSDQTSSNLTSAHTYPYTLLTHPTCFIRAGCLRLDIQCSCHTLLLTGMIAKEYNLLPILGGFRSTNVTCPLVHTEHIQFYPRTILLHKWLSSAKLILVYGRRCILPFFPHTFCVHYPLLFNFKGVDKGTMWPTIAVTRIIRITAYPQYHS